MERTKLSSKGQIILPKTVRQAHDWPPGTEFTVEDVDDGVLLRPLKPGRPARVEDLYGCLRHEGRARTIDEMNDAVTAEIRRRHAGGRY